MYFQVILDSLFHACIPVITVAIIYEFFTKFNIFNRATLILFVSTEVATDFAFAIFFLIFATDALYFNKSRKTNI